MTGAERVETDPVVPRRDPGGHKGTFGTVVVVGGSCAGHTRMVGAPTLTGRGALRAGAGLLRLVMPAPLLTAGLSMLPSATGFELPVDGSGAVIPHEAARTLDTVLERCDALAIGPGLGEGEGVQAAALRAVQQEETPVIVDADALNALAGVPELTRDIRAPAVLTPHPGEFRRIAEPLRISHDPTEPDSRPAAAESLAQRLGCVVVLKGSRTVVSDGHRTWVCGAGHACLGTAGTGDVLTGVIAGLVAQFVRLPDPALAKLPEAARAAMGAAMGIESGPLDLFEASRAGVLAHALAGERWAERHGAAGLLASELADLVPGVLNTLREG